MEQKQIEKLMMAMRRYGTKRLRLKKDDFEIELEREGEVVQTQAHIPPAYLEAAAMNAAHEKHKSFHLPKSETPPKGGHPPVVEESEAIHVVSPMVGTFYSASSPGEDPFIKVGDKIDENTVVCIVEAMKVMNEIKSGVSGTVKEILVEDGHPVEFGSKLFRVT